MDLMEQAIRLGFVGAGFVAPGRPPFVDAFERWLSRGNQAGMAWMAKNQTLRKDTESLLQGCRTILCLAYPYNNSQPVTPEGLSAARYTDYPLQDYHGRLKGLLRPLVESVAAQYPGARSRIFVDSAPVLERSLAYAAGLGWMGKNNLFMIPGHGSYVFLAELFTTAPIPFEPAPRMASACGTCTRCLEACPTGALESPFSLNASRCLSYLTIEEKDPVPGHTGQLMGRNFYGCDVCQEVCPMNQDGTTPRVVLPSVKEILHMDDGSFASALGRTAFARAGLAKLKNNLRAVLSWQGAGSASSASQEAGGLMPHGH